MAWTRRLFLAATFLLAILLGQAMTALEVIWILRLRMRPEEYVSERPGRAIREIVKLAEKMPLSFTWPLQCYC